MSIPVLAISINVYLPGNDSIYASYFISLLALVSLRASCGSEILCYCVSNKTALLGRSVYMNPLGNYCYIMKDLYWSFLFFD
jgi:hypothetical protein